MRSWRSPLGPFARRLRARPLPVSSLLIYLSLSTICREFLGFQWDILLLETGFLAIFFAPLSLLPHFTVGRASSRAAVCDKAVAIPQFARKLAPPSELSFGFSAGFYSA